VLWRIVGYRGRDLPGRGTIVVNYEPPDKLSPAEVGTLIDERVDQRDISAVITFRQMVQSLRRTVHSTARLVPAC
jgi:hypothetical protein